MIEKNITPNENLVQVFCGVRGYEEDGVAYLHIEDVARGLGFTEQKDGVEYVRWRTVDSHLSSLAFATSCESGNPHDYYIPENIFYRLCMKAKNEVAALRICTSKTWHVDWDLNEKRTVQCTLCGIESSNILPTCLSATSGRKRKPTKTIGECKHV